MFNNINSYANGQNAKVSIIMTKAPFTNVLREIEKQTSFRISYTDNVRTEYSHSTYNLNFKEAEVSTVLKFLLGSNCTILYDTQKRIIYLNTIENIDKNDSVPKLNDLSGIVRDKSGNAVPGATIYAKTSNRGTTSDDEGRFRLSGLNRGEKILISSVGFAPKEIIASDKRVIAELNPFINNLSETQIIAYGTTTRRNNTGNVTTVKASEIQDMPVTNPLLAIQGRVPGLEIRQSNGLPGAGISMRIQGANSLINGNDPLILVDGIPYPSQSVIPGLSAGQAISTILGQNGGTNNGQLGSPLSYINPSDIESIDVLKGADATSIYGSRAANGAILITTKKGRIGKPSITFNYQAGFKKLGRRLNLMDSKEYLQMRHEALRNDGMSAPSAFDYDLNGTWDTTVSHNWQQELLGNTGSNMLASISVQSGTENLQTLISGTFYNEDYIFPKYFNKKNDKRGSLHFSITNTSANKKFRITLLGNYLFDDNRLPIEDFVGSALTLPPIAPKLLTEDGSINWQKNASGYETFQNPMAIGLGSYRLKTTSLMSSLNISYELIDGLKVSTNLGFVRLDNDGTGTKPLTSLPPSLVNLGFPNSLQLSQGISTNWNIEPQINYTKKFKKSVFEALVGTTITNLKQFGRNLLGTNFSSDLVIEDLSSASQVQVVSSKNIIYKYNALFGRLTYNYDNKYIFNLNGRRDGSSRFGTENRFHSFGSIGAAWIFTEEKFFRNNVPFMNFGKLRSSYGTSGNDQIGDYIFLSLYSSEPALRPYQGVMGIAPSGLTNPSLQWEEIKKFEVGLETAFMDSRISFNINYALNRSSNQLMPVFLPYSTGFSNIAINLPAKVQNRVWELSISTINAKSPSFSWTTNITLTIPKSKLVAFPNIEKTTFSSTYIVGKSTTLARLFKSAGVNDTTGVYQFYDSKGNITYNPDFDNDRLVVLDLNPNFFGGIQNTINYKNFTLNFSFVFDRRYLPIPYTSLPAGQFNQNEPRFMLNRWQKAGDNATYQKYTSSLQNYLQSIYYGGSDKSYYKTSVLRCSNISLNWDVPNSWKKSLRMDACKFYTELLNPFLFTNNNYGLDPETGNSLPLLRTINFGVRATF